MLESNNISYYRPAAVAAGGFDDVISEGNAPAPHRP